MNKTHWKKAFNKDYLGAHDLEEDQELKLTIAQVVVKAVTNPNGEQTSPNIAFFTAKNVKPMILNATACKTIQRFSGSKYIEDWAGTHIQVYVMEGVKAFGDIVDALRIRDNPPRMTKDDLTPDSEKWDQAVESYKNADDKDAQIALIRKHYNLSEAHLNVLQQAQQNAA